MIPPREKKPLAEECDVIWIYAVQRAYGKPALLAALRQARPFRVPVSDGFYDLWLTEEMHRLPGKRERWSSPEAGNVRLWAICPECRKPVGKLFRPPGWPASHYVCRRCAGVTYLSVNSGGNRWYAEIVRPLRRLLRERAMLIGRKFTAKTHAHLAEVDGQIQVLREKAKPSRFRQPGEKYRNQPWRRQRRQYRNVGLLE